MRICGSISSTKFSVMPPFTKTTAASPGCAAAHGTTVEALHPPPSSAQLKSAIAMKPSPVTTGELGRRLSSRLFLASAASNSASKATTSEVGGHPGHSTTAWVTASDFAAVEVDVAVLHLVDGCVSSLDSVDDEVDVEVSSPVVFLAKCVSGALDSRIASPVGGNDTWRCSAVSKSIAQTALAWKTRLGGAELALIFGPRGVGS